MLGLELERNIREAWLKLRGKILSDPLELRRRLARRRLKTLTRPPRAWCIAIRASDRRITPAHWVITPEHAMELDHPEHPYEPIEHEVTIQAHAIRRYIHPERFSREEAVEVAKLLGVSDAMLLRARWRGQFWETFYKGLGGKRGKPVPILSHKQPLLDPSHKEFAAPHPIWGSMWEWLAREMPRDFEQTIIRRPWFVRYPGYDQMRLRGYRWVCPGCKKGRKTIYYPLPVRTLFDSWFTDPAIQLRLTDADLTPTPPASFACYRCHGVNCRSTIEANFWNQLICCLSGGMLYGREVERPAGFVAHRKRTRVRQLDRSAPKMREVMERFAKGWSDFEIAREVGITARAVECHIRKACLQENVVGRRALAKKLGVSDLVPPSERERAKARRERVSELLLFGLSNVEIGRRLGLPEYCVRRDVSMIYRSNGLRGNKLRSRAALAEKLGVKLPPTRFDLLREKVAELRERGMTYREIGKELGMNMSKVNHDLEKGRGRGRAQTAVAPAASETAAME